MSGGGAVKRSHPCENMRDSDIKGSTADGNAVLEEGRSTKKKKNNEINKFDD
ncbi:hypothetical protein F2Q68_00017998 [Brassica cretica]|uniref:Uncharacterized protein n=1 Tax=Brassica cretica TaxID=69181 RepID=A0A8S9HEY0_BRACR|nr:hypothetical protein F2Q68_00017998 [Brassica cretica]